MALIFLSYTHKDKDLAIKFENAIEKIGHAVWRDDRRVRVGDHIPEVIATGLSRCDFFAPLITENSVHSTWMKRELNNFLMDEKKGNSIIPLRFDETEISDFFPLLKSILYADFRENFELGINQIADKLGTPDEKTKERKKRLEKDLDRLDFAIDLALGAGSIAMRFYNSSIHLNHPIDERKNTATIADEMAQKSIISKITGHTVFAKDEIIAEEPPYDHVKINSDGYTWVIDALDGTTNFRNRIPVFCTAIGILKNSKPFIGVVFDPVNNDLYYALSGEQSKVWNVSKGEVNNISTSKTIVTLDECIAGTHISSRPEIASRLFKDDFLLHIAQNVNNLRTFGCGQLALAYAASGRLPLFFSIWNTYLGSACRNCSCY
ncbi:MAG: inositol monophosphatase family protein [Smithella sp.]